MAEEILSRSRLSSLMTFRIRKILMICSNYDAFIMEEDGRIDEQIKQEYIGLQISDPPVFIWANSSDIARAILEKDSEIDMIICMFNESDKGIFSLAADVKASGRDVPFVLLMHYSREIRRKLMSRDDPSVDFVFSWHGNADLILAIIKLFEDMKNAPHDILEVGVRAILLVEDSVRFYSTYLPELYKMVLTQSNEFLKETLNERQQQGLKRSRPKILLATCYNDALQIYNQYKGCFLGVISDVGMVLTKSDAPDTEKLDAGIDLINIIRRDDPLMPVLFQSSQASVADIAQQIGVGFLRKYSRTLFIQLSDYIKREFGFGEFVFRDRKGNEYGRASSLRELAETIAYVPDEVLVSNTSRNMFSKWFYARGLFDLAAKFRSVHHHYGPEARAFLQEQIAAFRAAAGRGIIAQFDRQEYGAHISFARIGSGSLGGKARGLAFLNRLIEKYSLSAAFDGIRISIPRTIVICTDFFDRFISDNGLPYVIDSELSDDEILSEFVASRLPGALLEELRVFIKTVSSPLAVRSSSKLEDSNYQPFAGVYSTYMIPSTENRDMMLRMLGKAIKSVYASAYYNGSRSYISTTGNLQGEAKMAIVIQEVCGSEREGLFYPMLSGVGRSVNFYPIGNEKASDGIVNVVFGLGKAVVEGGKTLRFSPKYPKKILQLSQPDLALRDTQTHFFALDMRPGAFKISRNEGVNFVSSSIVSGMESFPFPEYVCSTFDSSDGRIVPGISSRGPRIVSFDALLKYGRFPLAKAIEEILKICKKELMCDVEIEFALDVTPDGQRLDAKLLQVRPVSDYRDSGDNTVSSVREGIAKELIYTKKALGAGFFQGIDHIVMISPRDFDSSKTDDMAAELALINKRFQTDGGGYILIGPGRWGSSDNKLGVPVSWCDISEARLIVECGIEGFLVEPSQGTHFFQNITSLGVGYLSLNLVWGDDFLDLEAIESLPVVHDGNYVKVYKLPSEPVAFIDRHRGEAVVGL